MGRTAAVTADEGNVPLTTLLRGLEPIVEVDPEPETAEDDEAVDASRSVKLAL
jgi:hypothetical protein